MTHCFSSTCLRRQAIISVTSALVAAVSWGSSWTNSGVTRSWSAASKGGPEGPQLYVVVHVLMPERNKWRLSNERQVQPILMYATRNIQITTFKIIPAWKMLEEWAVIVWRSSGKSVCSNIITVTPHLWERSATAAWVQVTSVRWHLMRKTQVNVFFFLTWKSFYYGLDPIFY